MIKATVLLVVTALASFTAVIFSLDAMSAARSNDSEGVAAPVAGGHAFASVDLGQVGLLKVGNPTGAASH